MVVDLWELPPTKLVPIIWLGELEHVDFKENLFNAIALFASHISVDSNPRPVDPLSATLTARPQRSTLTSS